MIMEYKQADIFGKYKLIVEKTIKNNKPKKQRKKNDDLQKKLKILYELYYKLYEKQNINILEQREVILKKDLIIYPQEMQAEPVQSVKLNLLDDIDKRINIMQEVINKESKYEQL